MPEVVIKRVESIAAREGYKPHTDPIFKDYALLAGVDDGGDAHYDENLDPDYDPDDEPERGDWMAGYSDDEESDDEWDEIDQQELLDLQNEGPLTAGVVDDLEGYESDDSADSEPPPLGLPNNDDDQSDDDSDDELDYPVEPRRSTRTSKPPSNFEPKMTGQSHDAMAHLEAQAAKQEVLEYTTEEAQVLAMCFAQTYNLTQGLKKFKDKGKQATLEEMLQLHDRDCWRPRRLEDLTPKQIENSMNSLIFLTEKRDGRVKARTCADGSKQRKWMNKEEAASPTVHLESVLLQSVIDAKEGRDVCVIDIPNAFIITDNEKLADHHEIDIMKIKGRLADLLVEMAPEVYGSYVTKENGVSVIYLEILKAMYGMIKSPLLFYRRFRKDIEAAGFTVNPYDICVANKIEGGKIFTIMWHVDDIKGSHVDSRVNDNFVIWCKDKYEDPSIKVIKPSRGKVHDYLGITLDYSTPGKVRIYMKDYVKGIIKEFKYPEEAGGIRKVTSPHPDHLFEVNPKGDKLDPAKAEEFHTTVAKALFLCKRARPDLQPAVPFLCTRVQSPDQDDWKKLLRMLKYLEQTQNMELTLEADQDSDLILLKWHADAAFAVHPDMKSHTGGVLTLGKGAVNTISAKQRLNTRSSTEAELVAADDVLPQALWTKYFLDAQGYSSKTTLHQDNTSAMLLEKNGTESSSKRTRHINIRYYFIKDCISKQLLDVEYCPTDDMLADYPSKPLNGRKFTKFRRHLMNLKDGPVD